MTVIYVVISLVFSAFLYEPLWFDTRMHYHHDTYQSLKACKHASIQVDETTGRVCVPKDNHSGHVDLYLTKD
jgi:hypothetical protein